MQEVKTAMLRGALNIGVKSIHTLAKSLMPEAVASDPT